MRELVSVIIPIYNSEAYLDRCIKSVISQTYTSIEIILVDDGSADKSVEICDFYASQDSRIVAKHKKNGGVSSARNFGILCATGTYIVFIDSDDYVPTTYIEGMMHTNNIYPDFFVFTPIKTVGNQEFFSEFATGHFELSRKNQRKIVDWFNTILPYGPFCKLFFRETILKNHIVFDEKLSFGEDLVFNLNYMRHVKSVVYSDTSPYFYCIENMNSLSRSKVIDSFNREKYLSERIKEFMISLGIDTLLIDGLINERLLYNAYNDLYVISNSESSKIQKKKLVKIILEDPVFEKIIVDFKTIQGYSRIVLMLMKYHMYELLIFALKKI